MCGFTLVSCFSQTKDELVIELNNTRESFFIQAILDADFSCLLFPEKFYRARKNSIDLFGNLILKKVLSVRQFQNERSFALEMEGGLHLVFKMHGNFSNIVLIKENSVAEIFRNHLQTDFQTDMSALDRPLDFSKENFLHNQKNVEAIYFTFGKTVWNYLKQKNFSQLDTEKQWQLLQQTLYLLETPTYHIIENRGQFVFSLFPEGEAVQSFTDPILAVNEFAHRTLRERQILTEKKEVLHRLLVKQRNAGSYIAKNKIKLAELSQDRHYQLWADLVMAHLHTIKPGTGKITLNSFYDNAPVEIKMKPELNAQQNAAIFYRKAKNQQIEINKLSESIIKKEKELSDNRVNEEWINRCTDIKSLREITASIGLKIKPDEKTEPLPYREFEWRGFRIWVGKNAEANDQLTLKYSYKEDLWLHAKDVAGSHVLIKYQAGKNFPKDVIEYAAGLAAFYSKRKNESLCPVVVTPKKFVRKRKGDPAGAVVVEKEEVILVEPRDGSKFKV